MTREGLKFYMLLVEHSISYYIIQSLCHTVIQIMYPNYVSILTHHSCIIASEDVDTHWGIFSLPRRDPYSALFLEYFVFLHLKKRKFFGVVIRISGSKSFVRKTNDLSSVPDCSQKERTAIAVL